MLAEDQMELDMIAKSNDRFQSEPSSDQLIVIKHAAIGKAVLDLVKTYPNDMELGGVIRNFIFSLK